MLHGPTGSNHLPVLPANTQLRAMTPKTADKKEVMAVLRRRAVRHAAALVSLIAAAPVWPASAVEWHAAAARRRGHGFHLASFRSPQGPVG